MNRIAALSDRSVDAHEVKLLQVRIAKQLADGHGRQWSELDSSMQAAYLGDAEELIDQGLAVHWQDPGDPPQVLTPHLEAEVFAFDQAVEWFYGFLEGRHPGGGGAAADDPVVWDAWMTVVVQTSELVRRAWAERITTTQPAAEPARRVLDAQAALALSMPDFATEPVMHERVLTAICAVLAQCHGQRWMDMPERRRALYRRDAQLLIDHDLTVLSPAP